MSRTLRVGLLGSLLSLVASVALAAQIILTAGTTWTAPIDFGPVNTVEVIGHGGDAVVGGGAAFGGGGGAYAKIANISIAPGATVNIHFGASICSSTLSGTWFSSAATVYAESGYCGSGSGTGRDENGGRASASIGSTKFSGGNGTGTPGTAGGGGAAGPHGAGGNGLTTATGGDGDAGFGGAGGTSGGAGGNGAEFDASHGAGGGSGGGTVSGPSAAGLYGAGGGGDFPDLVFSTGAPGIIVINYQPVHGRVSSGVF